MSAGFTITPWQARKMADALDALTAMTRATNVRIDAYGPVSLRVAEDAVIEARWDDESREYVIDDRVGR